MFAAASEVARLLLRVLQPRDAGCAKPVRRQSALGWIQSGASVTLKTYARRYGVDRRTAHEDLTALGFPRPASAEHRPTGPPAHRTTHTPTAPYAHRRTLDPDTNWIIPDGQRYFGAG